MRKVLTFLSASMVLAWVVPAVAQTAPDAFKDVPTDHWAYQAVDSLRAKGVLIGYPDGLYRGRRTLTRYEFAVALKRALDQVQTIKGDKGDPGPTGSQGSTGATGEKGDKGDQGAPGVTPEELAAFKKLADEFKAELASMGVNVNALMAKLDKLTKDVAAIKDTLSKMPKVSGTAFIGMRVDRARGLYVDADGRLAPGKELVRSPVTVRALALDIDGKVGSDATFKARIINDNYRNYLNGNFAVNGAGPYGLGEPGAGLIGAPVNTNPMGQTYVDIAEVKAPFAALGRDGSVTLGRFGFNISPLTLWKPDTDTYFNNPLVDDGLFRMDGASLSAKLGSIGLGLFAGQTKSVDGGYQYLYNSDGMLLGAWPMGYNTPIAGGIGGAIFFGGLKPFAQKAIFPMPVDQLGGLTVTLPIKTAQEGSYIRGVAYAGAQTTVPLPLNPITNVAVLGVDTKLNLAEKFTVAADWAKTISGYGKLKSLITGQNNGGTVNATYGVGALSLSAGYKYIDPMFYAPGYWGKIGNWLNPTNIQGPSLKVGYEFTPTLGVSVSGEMYNAARNWAAMDGMGKDDQINRVLVGVRWDIARDFTTTVDWEGVYWKLAGPHSAFESVGTVHPIEQYVNIGTGYKVNDGVMVKLGYQIGTMNGKLISPNYNYNTLTTQAVVKF